MSLIQQLYVARFALGTDRNNFSLGSAAIALTTGHRYLFGYPTEIASVGTYGLIELMESMIQAEGTYPSATVRWSYVTNRVTIATGGAAAAITWTDAGLQTLLGFTGTQSSATSHTATNAPRYIWAPSRALSYYPTNLDKWWDDRYTGIGYRAPTGVTYGLKGNKLREGFYQYRNLTAAETVTDPATTVWESFQRFFEDTKGEEQPFRIYPDRTDARPDGDASPDVGLFTAVFAGSDESVKFSDIAKRERGAYQNYWKVDLDLHEWVQS
jgi:hypothetical protein